MTSGEYAFKDEQTRWHRLGMRPVPYLAESGQLVAVCVLYYIDLFFFFPLTSIPCFKIPLGLKIRSCCPIIGQTDLYISVVLLRLVCIAWITTQQPGFCISVPLHLTLDYLL